MQIREWITENPKRAIVAAVLGAASIAAFVILKPIETIFYFIILGAIPYTPFVMSWYVSFIFCAVSSVFLYKWAIRVKNDLDIFLAKMALAMAEESSPQKSPAAKASDRQPVNVEDLRIYHL